MDEKALVEKYLERPSVPDLKIELQLAVILGEGLGAGIRSENIFPSDDVYKELHQDGMYKALKHLSAWRGLSSLFSWTFSIGKNLAIDYRRKKSRSSGESPIVPAIDDSEESNSEGGISEEAIGASDFTSDEVMAAIFAIHKIRAFLDKLTGIPKQFFSLIYEGIETTITGVSRRLKIKRHILVARIMPYAKEFQKIMPKDPRILEAMRFLHNQNGE